MNLRRTLMLPALLVVVSASYGADKHWTTIKGKVVLDPKAEIKKMAEIVPTADKQACLAKGKFFDESYIVDPKSRAIKNVIIWIEPANSPKRKSPFPAEMIHEKLRKPAEADVVIDQPCCQFIPHIVTARVGQNFVIKNTAPVSHNAKYATFNNGEGNPLIQSGDKHVVKDLKLEEYPFTLACNIHPYMNAQVVVFDHPYYAVTDDKGDFEIKLAPQGKFKLFVWHETGAFHGGRDGAKGTPITIGGETMDLKVIEFKGK